MSPQDATGLQPFCMTGRCELVNIDSNLIWASSWRTIETGRRADKTKVLTSHPTLKLESWRRTFWRLIALLQIHPSRQQHILPGFLLKREQCEEFLRGSWLFLPVNDRRQEKPGELGRIQGFFPPHCLHTSFCVEYRNYHQSSYR